jgi:hypothetical protein
MGPYLRCIATALGLLLLAGVLSGCIVETGHGGGWCYWHPYRC